MGKSQQVEESGWGRGVQYSGGEGGRVMYWAEGHTKPSAHCMEESRESEEEVVDGMAL